MKRKGMSKRLRFGIFARDSFTCRYCGRQSDTEVLVVDHVIPVVQGGTDDPANLVTACVECNQGKAGHRIADAAPTETDRLRLAQEAHERQKAAEAARDAMAAREAFRQEVINAWCEIRGSDSVDRRTISTMMSYAEEHGFDRVVLWIQIANDRLAGKPDFRLGMYISGIRRTWLAEEGDDRDVGAADIP